MFVPAELAFVGSGCSRVLEIVAERLLAPALSISLYTSDGSDWTDGRNGTCEQHNRTCVRYNRVESFSRDMDSGDRGLWGGKNPFGGRCKDHSVRPREPEEGSADRIIPK